MYLNRFILNAALLITASAGLLSQSQLRDYDFEVVATDGVDAQPYTLTIRGHERKNNSQNRLAIISESQYRYPIPESGCGPTALLNTLVWYEKFGLIQPLFRESDPQTYKNRLFAEIDQRILEKSGLLRAEREGSRNTDIAMVLDEIVKQQSGGQFRIHTDFYKAPLLLSDLLGTMPNFRAGYLLGYPKSRTSGELQSLHAMLLIRADRAGYLTLATWGEKYRGLLRMRDGEQWFIPQSPEQTEIKITGMMRFIPFEPINDEDPTHQ